MSRKLRTLVALAFGALALTAVGAAAGGATNGNDFVKRAGPELRLHGKLFRFAGTNNYYLPYASRAMVDDVLERAAAQGFDVVRTWGFLDQQKNGVQFQYWDAAAGRPAFDDGPNGLQHLDYVIAKAGQLGLRLVVPFTNNWSDFGGMDQYVLWRGGPLYHDRFYTDPVIRQWYEAWVAHLLNHVNSITGVAYKDDPTIMTWELGNEPRCKGGFGASPGCDVQTLLGWADTMSRFVKHIDNKHLVSVGDEGFYCKDGATDWTENCGEGVDTVAFANLPAIDVMSFHLYPDYWGHDGAWGTQWIESHFAAARAIDKPAMLGEFGLKDDTSLRNPTYQSWLDAVLRSGGAGALYWILSGRQDDGSWYPDYDHFTVYCPSPVCTTISNFAQEIHAGHELPFAPVADDNSAVTEFQTPVTLNAVGNDIAYNGATVVPSSIRLAAAAVPGGTFAANPDGTVSFVPADGFAGVATTQYTVADTLGRVSNAATLTVQVKPNPTGILPVTSYEDGLAGATGGAGATVSQSTEWASDGTHSLRIDIPPGEGWVDVATFSDPLPDLTGKSVLELDLHTLGAQTYRKPVVQIGSGWTWCEGADGNTPQSSTQTLTVDLSKCGADLSRLHTVQVYLQGGGTGATFYVDWIRAE